MQRHTLFSLLTCYALSLLLPGISAADTIRVAVASNFKAALSVLADKFQNASGHQVLLSFGSTGKHYAQIAHGAPFDAFFAADVRRPELLEQQGLTLAGSRFTYAIGKLVLWSPQSGLVDAAGKVLEQGQFTRLAIANPRLAPYGMAAKQVLQARELWPALQTKLVRGENIAQAYQFIQSGNASLGFVAYAQIKMPGQPIPGSYWLVPQSLYRPIEQQAVLLKDRTAAHEFFAFIKSPKSLQLIRQFGYDTP